MRDFATNVTLSSSLLDEKEFSVDSDALSRRLCELSRQSFAPLPQLAEWPDTLDGDGWCMPLALSAVAATGRLDDEPIEVRKRVAFFELVNFFSLNVHGERAMLGGLGESLYSPAADSSWKYLHHFIDEENKHMEYFAGFCHRYAGKIYPDRKLVFPREHAPGEASFLFFAKVLIFEEIVDYFNRSMAHDPTLLPIVRDINRMHHLDEVRHLAFGRLVTRQLFEQWSPKWSRETMEGIRLYLAGYIEATFREYTNPEVYLDAGLFEGRALALAGAHALAREAFDAALPLRNRAVRRAAAFFSKLGLLDVPRSEELTS
jgi:hypothetical protein